MKQAYQYLWNLLKENDVVVVGVSFGPDSMALLHLLTEIRKKKKIFLVCAHVNHNVRSESREEAILLAEWCQQENILLESMVIEKYGDDNFHNEARSIRYHFFESLVEKYQAQYLMTAHHGDDLVETILMRLVRGSTLKGYGGFSQMVTKNGYQIIRPLISTTKEELLAYDQKYHIPYAIDASNQKSVYTRNRYRKEVLPFLKEEDPKVHEKFFKFSKLIQEADDFINHQVTKVYQQVYQNGMLALDSFLLFDSFLQKQVLYQILGEVYQDDLILVNDKHIDFLMKLIHSNKKNSYIYLPNHLKVIKSYHTLGFLQEGEKDSSYFIELNDYILLPNGKHLKMVDSCSENGNDICRLDSTSISLPLYVRTRKLGDKISLKGTNGHQKIKDIFMNRKIPMRDRELWPVLVDSKDEILWVPGLKKSKFMKQKNENCDIIIKYY